MNYGIIGYGVVGKGIDEGASMPARSVWDIVESKKRNPELLPTCDVIFICVPTPTVQMTQKVEALNVAILGLVKLCYRGVVVIKSTVLPGSCKAMREAFPSLRIVHSPEFMTARNAAADFTRQHRVMISGEEIDCNTVEAMYREMLGNSFRIVISRHHDYEVTEWAKYIHNGSLPVILSFLNEVREMIGNDQTFNRASREAAHLGNLPIFRSDSGFLNCPQVPGPDGKPGWGGMCFVKDMNALAGLAEVKRASIPTIRGAIEKNMALRPEEYEEGPCTT